jgi:hypothetical protein
MHWSVSPGAAGGFAHWGNPVIWQGTLGDPAHIHPRDTSMWNRGKHSLDGEDEIRLRPNSPVDIEGYWKPKLNEQGRAEGSFWPWQGYPHEDSGMDSRYYKPEDWEFVPMGKQLPIVNRGTISYPGFDYQSPDEVWDKHEQSQRPSLSDKWRDREGYEVQHMDGNPWGIGYGGPRPMAKPLEDQLGWHKEVYGEFGPVRQGAITPMRPWTGKPVGVQEVPNGSLGYSGRRPTIWDPETNMLYIGPDGSTHHDVADQIEHPWQVSTGQYPAHGWIGPNPEGELSLDDIENHGQPNEVGWYSWRGDVTPEAHQKALEYAAQNRRVPRQEPKPFGHGQNVLDILNRRETQTFSPRQGVGMRVDKRR